MPLNKKGIKICEAIEREYGSEKGKKVFYSSENKGRIKGVIKHAKTKALNNKKNVYVKKI